VVTVERSLSFAVEGKGAGLGSDLSCEVVDSSERVLALSGFVVFLGQKAGTLTGGLKR
jgi:hypothetical protein